MSKANEHQVGGDHYKKGGEEHWDRAWRLHYDPFQYIITKWVERWRDKGGVEDLRKARHAIDKYLELVGDNPNTAKVDHSYMNAAMNAAINANPYANIDLGED